MSKDNGGPAFPKDSFAHPNGDVYWGAEGMALRQYAAFKLRVPDSDTDWLDDMIRTSNRNELAARAMQAYLTTNPTIDNSVLAQWSFDTADAMLKQGEVE